MRRDDIKKQGSEREELEDRCDRYGAEANATDYRSDRIRKGELEMFAGEIQVGTFALTHAVKHL